ncbi:MAG: hypothetical protein HY940_02225 [Gammaproteobacteria bacterium]|nr:hypothetical protein [Gammaproteobacteria bacterium]
MDLHNYENKLFGIFIIGGAIVGGLAGLIIGYSNFGIGAAIVYAVIGALLGAFIGSLVSCLFHPAFLAPFFLRLWQLLFGSSLACGMLNR